MVVSTVGFNGATSNQTWKHPRRCLDGTRSGLLQWGHVQSDVETMKKNMVPRRGSTASMGPRPIRRGNEEVQGHGRWWGSLQWGHVQSDVETTKKALSRGERLSFNGATSNQTWKRDEDLQTTVVSTGFNGATSNQTWKPLSLKGVLCDNASFNGATSNQTWKLPVSRAP